MHRRKPPQSIPKSFESSNFTRPNPVAIEPMSGQEASCPWAAVWNLAIHCKVKKWCLQRFQKISENPFDKCNCWIPIFPNVHQGGLGVPPLPKLMTFEVVWLVQLDLNLLDDPVVELWLRYTWRSFHSFTQVWGHEASWLREILAICSAYQSASKL